MRRIVLILCCLVVTPTWAKAPDTSMRPFARGTAEPVLAASPLRPKARPIQAEASVIDAGELALAIAQLRPQSRPVSEQAVAEARMTPGALSFASPDHSIRPGLRPESVEQKAFAKRRARRQGAICGNLDIKGEEVGLVPGRISACGIEDAVRVRAVSGVALSQQSLMNCRTAEALNKWVSKGVKPAFGRRNPVVSLRVAAHYACRTRNNLPGARISEHGKGNAIDISGFVLENGEVQTVLNDYKRRNALGKSLRAACGTFGTVLGPNSDRFHRDHFHLDTARHRGGPYCR